MRVSPETGQAIKEERAIASGLDVFTRYGFARTTMGDIARGAGMSRPALYLLFPDKESLFERVVTKMDDAKHLELAEIVAGADDLGEKLLAACLCWGLHGMELTERYPDAADLFDLRFSAVRHVYDRFERLVAELIRDAAAASALPERPEDLARTLVYGMRGLRAVADHIDEMRRLMTIQVRAFARALDIEPSERSSSGG